MPHRRSELNRNKSVDEPSSIKDRIHSPETCRSRVDKVIANNVGSTEVLASLVTLKTRQWWSGQNRPMKLAGTLMFYPADSSVGKSVFLRQLREPHLSTAP